jgi:hypothetical protein
MLAEPTTQTAQTSNALDDLIDEFCYELAIALRRILNLDEEPADGDGDDDDGE